jgi:hypothetical protein
MFLFWPARLAFRPFILLIPGSILSFNFFLLFFFAFFFCAFFSLFLSACSLFSFCQFLFFLLFFDGPSVWVDYCRPPWKKKVSGAKAPEEGGKQKRTKKRKKNRGKKKGKKIVVALDSTPIMMRVK